MAGLLGWVMGRRAGRFDTGVAFPESLRQSLAVVAGNAEMASVWRCVLQHGHGGAHQVRYCPDQGGEGWIHWDESGFRLGRADPPPSPAREWSALRSPPTAGFAHRATTHAPEDVQAFLGGDVACQHRTGVADDHPADPDRLDTAAGPRHAWPENQTQHDALWAIAGSMQRLADAIVFATERLIQALPVLNRSYWG